MTVPMLVRYTRPGCGHCDKFAPVWDNIDSNDIGIAKHSVDTSVHGVPTGVTGVPTIQFMDKEQVVTYNGPRDAASIKQWVDSIRSAVSLKSIAFKNALANKKPCVVLFHTLQCPHCRTMKPVWDKVVTNAVNDRTFVDINVGKAAEHTELMSMRTTGSEIAPLYTGGVPAIYLFSPGLQPVAYEGGPDAQALAAFVSSPVMKGGGSVARRAQKLNADGLRSLISSNSPAIVSFDNGTEDPVVHDLFMETVPGASIVRVNSAKHHEALRSVNFRDNTGVVDRLTGDRDFVVLDGFGGAHTYDGDVTATNIRTNSLELLRGVNHAASAAAARDLFLLEQEFGQARDAFIARVDGIKDTVTRKAGPHSLFGGGSRPLLQGLLRNVQTQPRELVKSTVGAWVDDIMDKKKA